MTELRAFNSTQLLESFGYVLCAKLAYGRFGIGFMRRPQPEIHHGSDFPWVMATVGGMRNPMVVMDKDSGPNAEGFMGRPQTPDEVADDQTALKLGVKLLTWQKPELESWFAITHPFYYGNKSPDVRNVGTVFRKFRFVSQTGVQLLQDTLKRRNAASAAEHQHELTFLNESDYNEHILHGNSSLKSGEHDAVATFYKRLPGWSVPEAEVEPLPQYR